VNVALGASVTMANNMNMIIQHVTRVLHRWKQMYIVN